MTASVTKNGNFFQKLWSMVPIIGQDTYTTSDGQKIRMKAGQGRVEVGDNGEINIFDAQNVIAKGVDGLTDIFKLHNCSSGGLFGSLFGFGLGKNLNDVGDTFEHVSDENENGDSATDKTDSKTEDKADSNSKTDSTKAGDKDGSTQMGGVTFNTIVNGDNNTVTVTNNYNGQPVDEAAEEAEEAEPEAETESKVDSNKLFSGLSSLFTGLSEFFKSLMQE